MRYERRVKAAVKPDRRLANQVDAGRWETMIRNFSQRKRPLVFVTQAQDVRFESNTISDLGRFNEMLVKTTTSAGVEGARVTRVSSRRVRFPGAAPGGWSAARADRWRCSVSPWARRLQSRYRFHGTWLFASGCSNIPLTKKAFALVIL